MPRDKKDLYIKNEIGTTYIDLRKHQSSLALILLKYYHENISGNLLTSEILVSDIKKTYELLGKSLAKSEFIDAVLLLDKSNIISYDCAKERIFDDDTILTIFPSILCWLNLKDEELEILIEQFSLKGE